MSRNTNWPYVEAWLSGAAPKLQAMADALSSMGAAEIAVRAAQRTLDEDASQAALEALFTGALDLCRATRAAGDLPRCPDRGVARNLSETLAGLLRYGERAIETLPMADFGGYQAAGVVARPAIDAFGRATRKLMRAVST